MNFTDKKVDQTEGLEGDVQEAVDFLESVYLLMLFVSDLLSNSKFETILFETILKLATCQKF